MTDRRRFSIERRKMSGLREVNLVFSLFSFLFYFSFQFIFYFLFLELRVKVKTCEHKKKGRKE